MAVTNAEAENQTSTSRRRTRRSGGDTVLDDHVDKPSTVLPGDPPYADTMDPNERAISVEPDKASAARAGFGTVNAVVRAPEVEREDEPERKPRTEKYKLEGPDGKLVTVTHNLETGETSRD